MNFKRIICMLLMAVMVMTSFAFGAEDEQSAVPAEGNGTQISEETAAAAAAETVQAENSTEAVTGTDSQQGTEKVKPEDQTSGEAAVNQNTENTEGNEGETEPVTTDTDQPVNPGQPEDPDQPADLEEPAEPETPVIKNGWDETHTMYYVDDEFLKGYKKVDGSYYYFDPSTGAYRTGLQRIKGVLYYFYPNGKSMGKGWITNCHDKIKRYGLGNGRVAEGALKVGKNVYFFKVGKGAVAHFKGLLKYGNKEYLGKGNGTLATGWQIITEKNKKGKNVQSACYFSPANGAMRKNVKVGYLKVPASGRLGEAYVRGIRVLNKKGWNLRAAYKYSYKLKYRNRWMRKNSSQAYALVGFKNGRGNCAVMAGTFTIMGELLGYNIRQVYGRVGRAPHSWTEIKQDGKTYVYDPNFQNETHYNGWKIWYGKKRTWRYASKSYKPSNLKKRYWRV